jgi:hypothetical protein
MTVSRRGAVIGLLMGAGVLSGGRVFAAGGKDPLHGLDPDADGTIDLAEASKAASTLFDTLDKDREGTLDTSELRGRLAAKELDAGDPDKDKTLTKDEFLAIVEQQFKAADTDNDGTLSAKELKTPAGKALLKLLK